MIKKIEYLSIVILLVFISVPDKSFSQGNSGKKGGPPSWAPAHGYRAKTRHIYFPEHNFYFDSQKGIYIYFNGSKWSVSAKLPLSLKGLSLSTSTQIELDMSGDNPQKYNSGHKIRYKAHRNSSNKQKKLHLYNNGKGNENSR